MKCIEDASAELDALKVRLAVEEAAAMKRGLFDRSGQSAHFKAGCIVWIMATLEELFRCLANEIREDVTALCVVPEVLHASLTMALSQSDWQSAAAADRSGLARRADLITSHTLTTDAWPDAFTFLDGRTINDSTITMIWKVLRLNGPSFSNPAQPAALKDLAGRRNRVAHGVETVMQAGRALTFGDVMQKINHIDDMVTHLYLALDDWLKGGGWRP